MQRVLLDSQYEHDSEVLRREGDAQIGILRKHLPPSVADAYAEPRSGSGGNLEWWTNLQGAARPFASLSEGEQQALLNQYAQHQAQIQSLVGSFQNRGMQEQADKLKDLQRPADVDSLYSVEGRLLILRWLHRPEPPPPPPAPVETMAPAVLLATPQRRWWPWVLALLLLLLLLLLAWWFFLRPGAAAPVPAAAAPIEEIAVEEVVEEPQQAVETWPSVIVLLDSSEAMDNPPSPGSPLRSALALREIARIVGGLPDHTDLRLVSAGGGSCTAVAEHGPYTAPQRADFAIELFKVGYEGKAPLAAGLRAAADAVTDPTQRALIVAFAGGDDTCGQDICAAAEEIHQKKPNIRINFVDLSGATKLGQCVAGATGGKQYFYGDVDVAPVDLSAEVNRMVAQ